MYDIETKLARLTVAQRLKCALYIQAVATTAATAGERAALDRLANRFRNLAMEKSLPSSNALQTATAVLRRGHHLRETMQHPVVVGQAIELAYLLSAYGVAPTVGRVRPLNLRTTS